MPESCRNLQDAGPDGHTQRPEARKVPDGFIYRRIRRFSTNAGRAVADGLPENPLAGNLYRRIRRGLWSLPVCRSRRAERLHKRRQGN